MKKQALTELRRELSQAGASPAEIRRLLPIAVSLGTLKSPVPETLPGAGEAVQRRRRRAWLGTCAGLGLVAGVLLIVAAQAVLPTSSLYPVQKFTDNLAVSVHPQFRANIMMKRAQQVDQLVSRHVDSQQILATLADYTREADTYKVMPRTNYAAFEYCKSRLEQAAAAATPNVRQAITSSLQSLET